MGGYNSSIDFLRFVWSNVYYSVFDPILYRKARKMKKIIPFSVASMVVIIFVQKSLIMSLYETAKEIL